ncbi:MAG: CotH kinase family protein [Candidatus Electryonea clarkiae]|nr:CotH kinase family protein [Candidatus Electryonea clarkiae]
MNRCVLNWKISERIIDILNRIFTTDSCFFLVILFFLSLPTISPAQTIQINEVMIFNTETITDEYGKYSDWIELYNPGNAPVYLFNWGLSDDDEVPLKWRFPNVILEAGDFLLVFASRKDSSDFPYELHTNFDLDAAGETVILTSNTGSVIDELDAVALEKDWSYARYPDGGSSTGICLEPTPGESNGARVVFQRVEPPVLLPGGFYSSGISVEILNNDNDAAIYYTLDGSVPREDDILYTSAIVLNETGIIRAAAFRSGYIPSKTVTGSYFLDYDPTLPVVSYVTDPVNLWSEENGIYVEGLDAGSSYPYSGANFWQDWEIPVHIDFFEADGQLAFSQDAASKIHGGWTRAGPYKSLKVIARDHLESNRFNYRLYPHLPHHTFQSFLLRNSYNDWLMEKNGHSWYNTMIRDPLMSGLMKGTGIVYQEYRPVILFINGEYWGIHNIRERINKHFIGEHYNVDRDNIDLVENHWKAKEGDREAYDRLRNLVRDNNLNDEAVYDSVNMLMNTENFIRYNVAEIFYANTDWPRNNIRCWRSRGEDSRFEWILFDTDFGFGNDTKIDHNTLEFATATNSELWANISWSTSLFRNLFESNQFRERFIVCFNDMLNIHFRTERLLIHIDSLSAGIADAMPAHEERWFPDNDWESKLNRLRDFAVNRRAYVIDHLRRKYDLDELITLGIDRSNESSERVRGRVSINSFFLPRYP